MEMNTAEIKFFKLLRKINLSEDDAETFIALQKEIQADNLATKGDIFELKTELKSDINEVRGDIKGIRGELVVLKAGISTSAAGLEAKIIESSATLNVVMERNRTNILWAVVLFWLAQVGIMLGFAYKLFPGL